jgi:hypothetical protein
VILYEADINGEKSNEISLGIRANKDIISEIEKDNKGDTYCTICSSNGVNSGNEIYIVNKSKVKNIIELEEEFGPNSIINIGPEMYIARAV